MLAKIAIAVATYIALAPQVLSLKFRVITIALATGVIAGLVGTATRMEPASMIPVNLGGGILAGAIVAAVMHFATEAVMKFRAGS